MVVVGGAMVMDFLLDDSGATSSSSSSSSSPFLLPVSDQLGFSISFHRVATRTISPSMALFVNKWDTIPNKNQQIATYYEQDVREKVRVLDWAPIVYSTAIAGHNVDKIIVASSTVEKERSRRLSTSILNQVVQELLAFKSPPRTRGRKRGRVFYCTQAKILECHPNYCDEVKRAYLQKGPY
uniref:Uncharacterized protein n=1 Tax=Quercus lobata TaxID=97700 RepID=A0A7N2KNL3_QUELO